MKVIFSDKKKKIHKIRLDKLSDLWELSKVIEKGDVIESSTLRTVKIGNKEEKKKVFIELEVEKWHFSPYAGSLRITGKIISGKPEEFIQKGRYHSIDIKAGDTITIKKEFLSYQWKIIKRAEKETTEPIAKVISIDIDKIEIWKISNYYIIEENSFPLPSKHAPPKEREKEIEKTIEKIKEKNLIVIGNKMIVKPILEKLKIGGKNIKYVETSEGGWEGIKEALEKIKESVKELKTDEEKNAIEKLTKKMMEGLVAIGKEEVEKAAQLKAVEELLIHQSLLQHVDKKLLDEIEKQGGKIIIFSDSPFGEQLRTIGGIASILRFPIG